MYTLCNERFSRLEHATIMPCLALAYQIPSLRHVDGIVPLASHDGVIHYSFSTAPN